MQSFVRNFGDFDGMKSCNSKVLREHSQGTRYYGMPRLTAQKPPPSPRLRQAVYWNYTVHQDRYPAHEAT